MLSPIGRLAVLTSLVIATPVAAQRMDVQPAALTLNVGDSARVTSQYFDSTGNRAQVPILYFSSDRRSLNADSTGLVKALRAGSYKLYAVAMTPGARSFGQATRVEIPVTVRWPAIRSVTISGAPQRFYAGITVRHRARVVDAANDERTNVDVSWRSSNDRILRVDRFGNVTAIEPGTAVLTASAAGVNGTRQVTIVPNPARSVELTSSANNARIGDVVRFTAVAKDAAGRTVSVPVTFAVIPNVEDTVIAPGPSAEIDQDGRFVAQRAGDFSIVAAAGNVSARRSIGVTHRFNVAKIPDPYDTEGDPSDTLRGRAYAGPVREQHTSDIWVWTGKDGRDYAITGTWAADGKAYFWDVTDPTNPVRTDSVQVDARTVNDVKVDEERGLCFITREGASNRRNGFLVLDCGDPRKVSVLSRFDDGLYGGVHNIFYWNKRVFPINAGTRFDIINVEDPAKPYREGYFELGVPGAGIHDVWVVDGIAYASQWEDGVILVDVGNGKYGGTPAKPVFISSYKYPIGATHSAFPYYSKSANKFYVFVGDEQFPFGLSADRPEEAGGYIHVVDFTDIKSPVEVARYQIPEAGPHNFWVQNDTLYVAYYNAGLRVVDVSGELKGNLYHQGRELARFQARDPNGKVANSPMAWGPQPHKGYVFFSDFNSGLWAVKLPPRQQPVTP